MGAIIGGIVFGLIACAIAKLIMPGKDPGGIFLTIGLGIAGALVGGFIGRALWESASVTGWGPGSFGLAVGGAILLLAIYRLIQERSVRSGAANIESRERRDRDKWAA